MRDIVALMPMEGLVNMYLCQLGREGEYVSVVMARTVSRKFANNPVNTDACATAVLPIGTAARAGYWERYAR